ncbi:MAG TPA: OmpA family protein [Oxalicibacterium sp.]|uniref:OmpA family protein n=1 Tax=Oxalicibacterium sp. TaxID=2766525 RepID=UPI002C011097|nr:OmpA family protein [Oxalicibacterium sp.]HWU97414.1 OmpA family protein [Oxalicibacterium sp.]
MINKLALGFLMGASSVYVFAQTTDIRTQNDGYNQDSRGTVTRSGYGLCWRSGTWNPDDAIAGCDGALKPPIPNPIAPEVQTNLKEDKSVASHCDFTATLKSGETFASGKTLLNAQAKNRINSDILPKLAQCKTISSLAVTGHTDHIGSKQFNQRLSENRASAVANYLKENGINTSINIHGAGDTQALTSCDQKLSKSQQISCLAPNRRVTIEVHGLRK